MCQRRVCRSAGASASSGRSSFVAFLGSEASLRAQLAAGWRAPAPAVSPPTRVTLLRPHLRNTMDELVPGLLGIVGIGAKAAEFGPRGGTAGADIDASAGEDIERCGALGDTDRI